MAMALVAGVALAGCEPDPNRFDLACHLTQHFFHPKYPDEPFDNLYRVDMKSLRWCDKDCSKVQQLKVNENELVFAENDETSNIDGDFTIHTRWRIAVNRWTGFYESKMLSHIGPGDIVEGPDTVASASGNCVKRPFQAFPTHKF